MDDTICHYANAHKAALEANPAIQFPQSQYGFYLGLKPIDRAIWWLNKLTEYYDVWILTRPSIKNPLCYIEKRVWVEQHLGMPFCEKLIICPEKGLLRGDYLVDDFPWPTFQGEQILFGSETYPNWDFVGRTLFEKSFS